MNRIDYTWDNARMQLFDRNKGSIGNRAACAGELMLNTVATEAKLTGVTLGTALAVDTFAGNKVAMKGAKKLATSVGTKASAKIADLASKNANVDKVVKGAAKAATTVKTYADETIKTVVNSESAKTVKSFAGKVANNETVKKAASKVAEMATKVKNSSFVKTLSKHKVGIIIAAGLATAAGVVINWAQDQADIEQKYEDKAKAQQ